MRTSSALPQGKGSAGRVLEDLVAKAAHQGRCDHAATVTEPTSLPGTTTSRKVPATFRYVVVDVFTDTPLAGNQLAVFTDAREIPRSSFSRSRGR